MLPGGLVFVTLPEDGVHNVQFAICTYTEKEDTVVPNPMLSNGVTPELTVAPNHCIEVTHENDLVCLYLLGRCQVPL